MPRVTFLPAEKSVEVEAGISVMEAANQIGVKIPTTCGGKASCRLCMVRIQEGYDQSISPMGFEERNALGNVFFITRERLSCQCRVLADLEVSVPEAPAPLQKKKPVLPSRYRARS